MHAYPSPDPAQQHQATQSPPLYHDPNYPHQQQQHGYYQPPQHVGSPPPAFDASQPYPPPQGQPAPQQYAHYTGQPSESNYATHVVAATPAVGSQYQNTVQVGNLQRSPAPVDCPACGQRGMTSVFYESGNTTQ